MPHEVENEQEVEVVSLLTSETPDIPKRKGYEDYLKEAEAPIEDSTDDSVGEDDKDSVIPEKFKGKSFSDVIESYTQLEAEYGRRNSEIGELRKLTDQLLELKTSEKSKEEPTAKAVDVDSLLENPSDAINSAVDSNPKLKAIEEKLLKEDREKQKAAFESKHPDWQTTMQTPEFLNWIAESPLRKRLFLEADRSYDYATGSEIFDMYEETRGKAIQTAVETRDESARTQAKKAVTEKSGSQEGKAKKKFKRSEIVHMKLYNKAKFEAMKEEIMQAYADGNVI